MWQAGAFEAGIAGDWAAGGTLANLTEMSGPSGPLPWAKSFPSTEISMFSGVNLTTNRCHPGVLASRCIVSAGPESDSTARVSSVQPGKILTSDGPIG